MEWHFCPRCETELDVAMACPACPYDATVDLPTEVPEPLVPYVKQYRGTPYARASTPPGRPMVSFGRTRVLVAAAILGVAALYGSILVLSDLQGRETGAPGPIAGSVIVP